MFLRYSWEPLVNLFKRRQLKNGHHSKAFFHTQFGAYIASLMLSNALGTIGFMVNGQWAVDKMVIEGAFPHVPSPSCACAEMRFMTAGTLCNTQGTLEIVSGRKKMYLRKCGRDSFSDWRHGRGLFHRHHSHSLLQQPCFPQQSPRLVVLGCHHLRLACGDPSW